MTILALETSTNTGSLALFQDDQLLHQCEFAADRSLGAQLFPLLQTVVEKVAHIDQIVVGLGPGSYSGVRIAISAAMGLSISMGAELVGISSLLALPSAAPVYLVIGDARRNSFYFTSVLGRECVEGPLLLSPEDLQQRLSRYQESPEPPPVFASSPLEQFPAAHLAIPSAAILATLSQQGKGIVASGDLEPIYLRDPHITLPKPIKVPSLA